MSDFFKKINKYIILLIISSLFGMPWIYIRYKVFNSIGSDSFVEVIPTIVDYTIKLIVIVLLIVDFKKDNLKNIVLTVIAAFLYPLLGIVIYSLLLIDKEITAGTQQEVEY
jgi:hypothetical protein